MTVEMAPEEKQAAGTAKKPAPDPRMLPPEADFGRLVAAANELDERGAHLSRSGCLLRGTGTKNQSWKLEADLAAAVRPLPEVPTDLEKRLKKTPGPVHVLTRWGRVGKEPFNLVLVAFTTTTPSSVRHSAAALLLTDAGVFLRYTDAAVDRYAEPLGLQQLGPLLAERASHGPLVVYVTAESHIRLTKVRELLSFIPERDCEVVLAVPLAPGTRLPEPLETGRKNRAIWCPEGLPVLPADAAEGDIEEQAIRAALQPFTEGAQRCLAQATGEAAAGGKISLALRVGVEGKVEELCLTKDEIKNATLGTCLIETARALSFPAPQPQGFVDIVLPLRLAPTGFERQRPLCR